MSIWTVTELNEQITAWKAALKDVAAGREFTDASGRKLTYADLPEIRKTLRFLESEKQALSGTQGPVFVRGRVRR